MESLHDLQVVFVGCGGTFWYGAPYFSNIIKILRPKGVTCIDPDQVTQENTARQWSNLSHEDMGVGKAALAASLLLSEDRLEQKDEKDLVIQRRFDQWVHHFDRDEPVLMIVNVDNDEARLQCRKWAKRHPGMVVMVTSGCEKDFGQVFYGVYPTDHIVIHDWLIGHPDLNGERLPVEKVNMGCATQTSLANMATASLFAPALEDAVMWYSGKGHIPESMREWYWRLTDEKGLRTWTTSFEPSWRQTKREEELV